MFAFKYLALAAVVAVPLLPLGSSRSIELSDMINKTVCAIEVRYDVDPDRVPQRIKMITCAARTDQGCVAHRIGHRHCCHRDNKMECVEMRDMVLVLDKRTNESRAIEVSVGCACMIRTPSSAESPADAGR